jgi:hypothetical protein
MLHVLRGRGRLLARALALLLLVGTAIPTALHAGWDDDPLCEPVLGGTGTSHVQASSGPAPRAEHCAVCHWLQSLRSLHADPAACGAELPLARWVTPEALLSDSRQDAPSLPARAPPA